MPCGYPSDPSRSRRLNTPENLCASLQRSLAYTAGLCICLPSAGRHHNHNDNAPATHHRRSLPRSWSRTQNTDNSHRRYPCRSSGSHPPVLTAVPFVQIRPYCRYGKSLPEYQISFQLLQLQQLRQIPALHHHGHGRRLTGAPSGNRKRCPGIPLFQFPEHTADHRKYPHSLLLMPLPAPFSSSFAVLPLPGCIYPGHPLPRGNTDVLQTSSHSPVRHPAPADLNILPGHIH